VTSCQNGGAEVTNQQEATDGEYRRGVAAFHILDAARAIQVKLGNMCCLLGQHGPATDSRVGKHTSGDSHRAITAKTAKRLVTQSILPVMR